MKVLSKVFLGLALLGALLFIGALYFLLWKVSGGQPFSSAIIPFQEWAPADQRLFLALLYGSFLLMIVAGLGGILLFGGRRLKKCLNRTRF